MTKLNFPALLMLEEIMKKLECLLGKIMKQKQSHYMDSVSQPSNSGMTETPLNFITEHSCN